MSKGKIVKEIPMEFNVRGYEMDGDKAIGIIVDNGIVLKFQDKDGNPIPLNQKAIENFLKGADNEQAETLEDIQAREERIGL